MVIPPLGPSTDHDASLDLLQSYIDTERVIPDTVFAPAIDALVEKGATWQLRDALLTDDQIAQLTTSSWTALGPWLDNLRPIRWTDVVALVVLLGEWGASAAAIDRFMARAAQSGEDTVLATQLLALADTIQVSDFAATSGGPVRARRSSWRRAVLQDLEGARVVLIGGYALEWHMAQARLNATSGGQKSFAAPGNSRDLDLCYADDPETRARLAQALRTHGATESFDDDFWAPAVQRVVLADGAVDLLRQVSGCGAFAACQALSDVGADMPIRVLGRTGLRDSARSLDRTRSRRQLVILRLLDVLSPQ